MELALGKTLVIACDVLRDQIESFRGNRHEIVYLEQGLHRTPGMLKEQLQKVLNESAAYDTLLLGYGLCSRAVIGLQALPHQTLIIPKIDDCIGLSLGERDKYYEEFTANPGTYYFTKGWIEAAEDPMKEYHITCAKYGEEIAEWTAKESLKHYTRTVLIKTSELVDPPSKKYVQDFADFFNLNYEEMPGSLKYLYRLINGPWDNDFVIINGGQITNDDMFSS